MEKLYYLKSKHPLIGINKEGCVPVILKDGKAIGELMNCKFDGVKIDKNFL